jgi:hypothetical protein
MSRALTLTLVVCTAVGCSGLKVTTESSRDLPRYTIRSLALVPFGSITVPQMRDQRELYFSVPQSLHQTYGSFAVPSSVEPLPTQAVAVPEYAAEKLTQLFWKRLQSREGVQLLPLGDSAKAASAEGEAAKFRPETLAAAVAKRLGADAALIGFVSVYQERIGSRIGANPPAAVGFEVKVVAADGTVLWMGNYYERQRPLNEDVLGFVQRLGMFVTAEELAQYGVDEILKEFPFGKGSQP